MTSHRLGGLQFTLRNFTYFGCVAIELNPWEYKALATKFFDCEHPGC